LVKRQEFYQQLIASLDQNSEKMRNTIEASNEKMASVLKMNTETAVV